MRVCCIKCLLVELSTRKHLPFVLAGAEIQFQTRKHSSRMRRPRPDVVEGAGGLRSDVQGWLRGGRGGRKSCTVRLNASWVMVTWRPPCGKTGKN